MDLVETQPATSVVARSGQEALAQKRSASRRRHRLRMKRLRQALLVLVLLALALAVTLVLLPEPVPVDVVRVTRGPLAVEVRETGQTRVKDRYVVSAPVGGSLMRLGIEPNDPVAEGASLAQLVAAPAPLLDVRARAEAQVRLAAALSGLEQAESQVILARTARELAELEASRARALAQAGSLEQRALEQAEFLLRTRAGEVASAEFARKVAAEQARLARAALAPRAATPAIVDVQAPVTGTVLRVYQESAAVVAAGTQLCEIGDLAGLEVVVDLLTTDAVQVRPGTPVVAAGWGGERGIWGRVRKVELAAFTRVSALGVDEQRANVIIAFDEPRHAWAALGDGYRVEVRIVLWEGQDVVKVPQGAIFRRGEAWAVFRADDGVARLTPIRIGHRGDAEVEVISGLDPGSTVVLDPSDRIEDGTAVKARAGSSP